MYGSGRTSARCRCQAGVSLIELLVALTLGAFITVGIIQMFTANQRTYQVNMGQARLQENARFALEFIASSLRTAGYRGCSNRTGIVNFLGGSSNLVDQFDMSEPISGHSGQGSGWTPSLDSLPDDIDTDSIASGTDVLVMRKVLDMGVAFHGTTPSNSAQSFVSLPEGCDSGTCDGFESGSVVMASDCLRTAIFVLNGPGSKAQPGSDRMLIVHNTGSGGSAGLQNTQNPVDAMGARFNETANLFRVGPEIFFIAEGAGTNNLDETPLALWHKRGQGAPVELVEGVQGLTLLYGEDTNGDRVPNLYRRIHQVGSREDIVTIRVTISATSVDAVADGDVLQRDFSKTVALRNRT